MSIFATVDEVCSDIKKGRQQAILFMGEKRFYYSPRNFEIDTIKILRNLESIEVPFKFHEMTEDELYDQLFTSKEEYLEWCIEKTWGNIQCDNIHENTYNWNAQISNHIDFRMFEMRTNWNVIALRVNLHGDVRANYSPWMIFSCYDRSMFFDKIYAIEEDHKLYCKEQKWEATIIARGWDEKLYVIAEKYGSKSIEFETSNYEKEWIVKEIEENLNQPEEA